jgi:NTE family protein
MNAKDFTQNSEVQGLVDGLRQKLSEKQFSDILDAAGNQYVDLVMEGGGVLGIALVGYTYVLEEMGIRFLRIGGTSAGSINALLVAGMAPPAHKKSGHIIEALANLPLWDFVDGGSGVQRFIRGFLRQIWMPLIVLSGLMVVYRLFRFLGLSPGDRFEAWLSDVLKKAGIVTAQDLRNRMRELPPGLKKRTGEVLTADEADAYLAIVSADVTTETKVEFPKMAPLYWMKSEEKSPSLWVRASMSIPYFFKPYVADRIPRGDSSIALWKELAHLDWNPGEIPASCTLVDGGIMSNFPIDLFHANDTVPLAPTFGVKLGGSKRQLHRITNPFNLGGAAFNAARHTLDYDFIARHPDYQKLVAHVDTSGFNWLDFEMEDGEKITLFIRGARAASAFLEGFDWGKYKIIRTESARAYLAAQQ